MGSGHCIIEGSAVLVNSNRNARLSDRKYYKKPFQSVYRPDIDGLRAIAVISVVVFHAFPRLFPGGFIGVDVFFVISGYLISNILLSNLAQSQFNLTQFYGRRVLRIFPALILILVFCLALGWFLLLSDEYEQLGKQALAGIVFLSNFILWLS